MKKSSVRSLSLLTLFGAVLLFWGCDRRPFSAQYLSPDQVEVTYQGRTYLLNRFGPPVQTPFAYSFERDGDLDLSIDGREYEVDSPYDRDTGKKVKKKKAKVKKKKSRKSTGK